MIVQSSTLKIGAVKKPVFLPKQSLENKDINPLYQTVSCPLMTAKAYADIKRVSFSSNKALESFNPIDSSNINNIVDALPKDKRPIVFTDFDGTMYPLYIEHEPDVLIQNPEFVSLTESLKGNNVPFFVLSARALNQFYPTDSQSIKNKNLNIIALNGNEMSLNLPKNEKSLKFIDKYKNDNQFNVSEKYEQDSINFFITPKLDENYCRGGKKLKEIFAPLGFIVEDKGITVALRWRRLQNKVMKENNETYNMGKVSNEIFEEIKEFNSKKDQSDIKNPVEITNSLNNDKVQLDFDTVLEYAINKFYSVYAKELGHDYSKDDGVSIKLTRGDKKTCEIRLNDYFKQTKGTILEEIFDIYNSDSKSFPVFLGDSLGNKDDEPAIKKANELGGFGIGILCRFPAELNEFKQNNKLPSVQELKDRLQLNTDSKFLLESYEQSIPLLCKISDNYVDSFNRSC